MTKIAKLIVLSVAVLLLANSAVADGSWESPRYWNAFKYSDMPTLGQEPGWASDYGIVRGSCNASLVETVVAEPVNADGESTVRLVATLHGPVLKQTPSVDAIDRGCMGHALELAPSFLPVRWTNPETHGTYILMPMRRLNLHGHQCRLFSAETTLDGNSQYQRGTACRLGHGDWYMI